MCIGSPPTFKEDLFLYRSLFLACSRSLLSIPRARDFDSLFIIILEKRIKKFYASRRGSFEEEDLSVDRALAGSEEVRREGGPFVPV